MAMRSSKHAAEKNRGISEHMRKLHERLLQALDLGIRCVDKKDRRWQSEDIEIQKLAVRSISAFVDCVSPEMSKHPLVKESVTDMLLALEGILRTRNEAVLGMAAGVTVKLINVLGNSILRHNVLELVHPLSSLLSSLESPVVISCAIALNQILSKLTFLGIKRQKEVWKILKDTNAVFHIVCHLKDFVIGSKPLEYFQEMAFLLRTILWLWPSSRYSVWSDSKLMQGLEAICSKLDSSVEVAALQLFSALALCYNGAMKLLEDGEAFLSLMVHCMGSPKPHSVRLEAFKLANCLTISEQGCLAMMKFCCEPIAISIINAMTEWRLCSGKVSGEQVPLLVEACRLALISRWDGNHHKYFWKLGIDQILLDLLSSKFLEKKRSQRILSMKELLAIANEMLDANYLPIIRPYIWDILGWLAINCRDDFIPTIHGNSHCLNVLIACACLVFVDSICKGRQVCTNDPSYPSQLEPASRAILMMIYSSCKYVASQARDTLSEVLMSNGEVYLKNSLDTLKSIATQDMFEISESLYMATNLMGLTCCSGLPRYQNLVIQNAGVKVLSNFVRWCLSNHCHIRRSSIAPHLRNILYERTCCWVYTKDWEGEHLLLFYSLWGLAELIHQYYFMRNHCSETTSGQVLDFIELELSEAQKLVDILQEICKDNFSPGLRWYAAKVLSYFGIYGFQSRLGDRVGEALNQKEFADLLLIHANEESLRVHGIILFVRCPALLPPGELFFNKKTTDGSSGGQDASSKCKREVRLSAHVDHQALVKLLEFVYVGVVKVGNDLRKQLKRLAKHCCLQFLVQMLCEERPKWGAPIPCYDLIPALGPAGNHFSDVILEAKASNLLHWTCSFCSYLVPHLHVHKIILWSSCDYMRALFQSGMRERFKA